MRAIHVRTLIALVAVAALVPATAWASLFEPVSDRQLVCEAIGAVRGEVVAVNSTWEGKPQAIWTRALIRVDKGLRGQYGPGDYVEVKEIGGTVGDYTIVAHQFPTFQVGEEVVILVGQWDDGSGELRVHGYGRGMFGISRQPGRPALAHRYDVLESRQPVMHVDRIPPVVGAEDLEREVRGLSAQCGAMGGAR